MTVNFLSARNRIRLSRLGAVLIIGTLSVSLTGWGSLEPFLEHLLSLVGWVLIAVAVAGRVWCTSHIGGNKNTTLITIGPYSVCRNPLYFFSFVGGLGVMFVTETLSFPLLFCVAFAFYYPKVIRREEEALLKFHGAEYMAYCSKVSQFWPKFSLLTEPNTYVVSASQFRSGLADMVWFIVAGGLVEYLEGLHVSGYLPVLLHIY
jgi:protein-S-isoprenylcysteine O-methyltransferase Ste14